MTDTAEDDEDDQDPHTLVYQEGVKIQDEYFIVGVYEKDDHTSTTFAAFELERSVGYQITLRAPVLQVLLDAQPALSPTASAGAKQGCSKLRPYHSHFNQIRSLVRIHQFNLWENIGFDRAESEPSNVSQDDRETFDTVLNS